MQESHNLLRGFVVELFRAKIKQRADAHLALRQILSTYLSQPPEKIEFELTAHGKPTHPKIFFSLTHSRNLALIAVSLEDSVGVDVEYIRPVPSKLLIARRFFAPSEQAYLERQPAELQESAFFELWTAKEALTKAHGSRLMDELPHAVAWDRVIPVQGLEGYVGHLAFQSGLVPLKPVHVSDFNI